MNRFFRHALLALFVLAAVHAEALGQDTTAVTATLTLSEPLPSFSNSNNIDFRPTPQGPVLTGFSNSNDFDVRPEPVAVDTTDGKKRLRFTVPWPEGEVKVEVTKNKDGTYVGNCTQGKVTVPCMMAFPNNNNFDF